MSMTLFAKLKKLGSKYCHVNYDIKPFNGLADDSPRYCTALMGVLLERCIVLLIILSPSYPNRTVTFIHIVLLSCVLFNWLIKHLLIEWSVVDVGWAELDNITWPEPLFTKYNKPERDNCKRSQTSTAAEGAVIDDDKQADNDLYLPLTRDYSMLLRLTTSTDAESITAIWPKTNWNFK